MTSLPSARWSDPRLNAVASLKPSLSTPADSIRQRDPRLNAVASLKHGLRLPGLIDDEM